MDTSSFIALLYNAALLIALGVIYDALNLEFIKNRKVRDLISGLLVGMLGLAVMNTSWEMAPGMFFGADPDFFPCTVCHARDVISN